MKRLWAACLVIIGLNMLILAAPGLFGQQISDIIVLAIGAIDLIACPILVITSIRMYAKK